MSAVATHPDSPPSTKVSVVIPVYNHEAYVAEAIRSALAQTHPPHELIVIDDGSTDRSAQIVEEFARAHPQLRFWSRPNRGAHATLNEGVRAATGELVAILNSDDVFHPERLSCAVAVLEVEPDAGAFASGVAFIDGGGQRLANAWYERARESYREHGDLGLSLIDANFLVSTSNLVARRSLFDELGGFAQLRYAHDLDFFLRVIAARRRLIVTPRALVSYRMHARNTIAEGEQKIRVERALVAAIYAWRLARGSERPPDPARWREVVERNGLARMVGLFLTRLGAQGIDAVVADDMFRQQLAAVAGG